MADWSARSLEVSNQCTSNLVRGFIFSYPTSCQLTPSIKSMKNVLKLKLIILINKFSRCHTMFILFHKYNDIL